MTSNPQRWSDHVWKGIVGLIVAYLVWMNGVLTSIPTNQALTNAAIAAIDLASDKNAEQIDKLWTRTADSFTREKAFSMELKLIDMIHKLELASIRERSSERPY